MTGAELKQEREEIGLSQVELAGRLGIDPARYAAWEDDREALDDDLKTVLRLAVEMVGVTLEYERRRPETQAVLQRHKKA
jgi:transcriptional regulator with XRE-family HTH domain